MNYLLKPKPNKAPALRRAFVVVFAIVLLLFIFSLLGSNASYAMFGRLAKPFWSVEQGVENSIGNVFVVVENKETLADENAQLKAQLQNTAGLQLQNEALISENETLKGLDGGEAGEASTSDSYSELARVLSSPAQSFYDIFTVALQPDSKVAPTDLVFGPGSVALGTVLDRSGTLARVLLFSSSGIVTDVELQKDGSHIQLTGQGDGSFVGILPRSLVVSKGDIVMLPSFNDDIIGEVGAVEPAREDSFQNVYVRFPVNVAALSWVTIQTGE